MSNIHIEQSVMDTLKEKHIVPISPIKVWIYKYVVFVSIGVAGIFASLSFGAFFFVIDNADWLYYKHVEGSFISFIVRFFPFFWTLWAIVFTAIALYAWKRTPRGYKVPGRYVAVGALGISLCIGLILHACHIGKVIDDKVRRAPFHKPFNERQMNTWNQKDKGLVSGVVVESGDSVFVIEGKGASSTIVRSEMLPGGHLLAVGKHVRVLGTTTRGGEFVACIIFPWEREFFTEHRPISPPKKDPSVVHEACAKLLQR